MTLASGLAVWSVAAEGRVSDTNLLANPAFDRDLAGWLLIEDPTVVTEWRRNDAEGRLDSGSAALIHLDPDPATAVLGLFQCVAVVPGAEYRVGADLFLRNALSRFDLAEVVVFWAPVTDCTEQLVDVEVPARASTSGVWTRSDGVVVAPPTAVAALIGLGVFKLPAGDSVEAWFDNVLFAPVAPERCIESGSTLCLHEGRFRATVHWVTASGRDGDGDGEQVTSDSGYFWFFDPANVEIVLKVLDACAIGDGRYWVFAGGLTNVQTTITVTDTASGIVRRYRNPQGTAFEPLQDTDAFDACP